MTSTRLHLAMMALAGAALASCSQPIVVTDWSPTEQPSQLAVSYTQLAHPVRYVGSSDRFAVGERERLIEFGRRRQLGHGDRIEIATAPTNEALARRRSQAAMAALNGAGVRFFTATQVTDAALPRDAVELRVPRHLVSLPACPNWTGPANPDYSNRSPSNFGCATTTNLGLMVADPADLIGGRDLGGADGAGSVLSVQRYRLGTPRPLEASGTSNVQATGAGQAQQSGTAAGGGQ